MGKRVKLSKKAQSKLTEILGFLNTEWGEKAALNLIDLLQRKVVVLTEYNDIGYKASGRNTVRKVMLTKYNYLIYQVYKNHITIIDIEETRQDAKNKKYK